MTSRGRSASAAAGRPFSARTATAIWTHPEPAYAPLLASPARVPVRWGAMMIRPGVSAVILGPEGVLLQHRSDNYLWGLPGGAVEPGESVREALAREVREETGLEVEPLRLVGVYSSPEHHQIITYPDGNVIHYVSSCFECRITGGTIACGPESLACAWFDPERLPPDLMPISSIRIRDTLARELAIVNAHTDEHVTVRYRREDGTYDPDALARLRRVFRSSGDAREQDVSLRLIEVLSHVQKMAGGHPLVLLSGYRSPTYNQSLKNQGKQVAGGSMHTEGLAADLAFPRPQLPKLWHQVRDLDCCGAGYYAKEGFLHVDVGRPRFWEATTSRVDENLSAGNARMFARTEFDRYVGGEPISVTLHALTVPPVQVARVAKLLGDGGV
ncbi:MAG: DUF882 domain-containing protein, partial [Deltaproteobacteria bacterium]